MTFELKTGMQVVERRKTKKGTIQEFLVSTFCEEDGWFEVECSAARLDYIKQREIDLVLTKKD